MIGYNFINSRNVFLVVFVLFLIVLFCATTDRAAVEEVAILVKAVPHNDHTCLIYDKLQPPDFDIHRHHSAGYRMK